MSHQVNGDASKVPFATRAELQAVEEKVDTALDDNRIANAGIQKLLIDVGRIARVQEAHSKELASISSTLMNIEVRLFETEHVAELANVRAELASRPDDTKDAITSIHLAKEKAEAELEIERRRDSVRARQDRRAFIYTSLKRVGKYLAASGAALALIAGVAKSCGVEVQFPKAPADQAEEP